MNEPATLIILAGGRSSRMGVPKHALHSHGRSILGLLHERLGERFVETLVIGATILGLPAGCRSLPDRHPHRGPLGGIATGLVAASTDLALILACDMPDVAPRLACLVLHEARGVAAAVPVVRGYDEPLCAAYRKTCVPAARRLMKEERLAVRGLYDLVTVRRIPELALRCVDPDLESFVNLNTPRQIEVRQRRLTPAALRQTPCAEKPAADINAAPPERCTP